MYDKSRRKFCLSWEQDGLAVGLLHSSVGEKQCTYLKTNDAECNTHLIQQDVVPDHDPRTRVGSLLERRYAGSCLRQVTQDAAKKKEEKNSVLLNIESRM